MILRDLAAAWVRTNCPRVEVQNDFLKRLDDALQRGVGCSFVVGGMLTRSGNPFLVYCFCGELFAFQLTPSQAARLKTDEHVLVSALGLNKQNHEPRPHAPIRLEKIVVDNADALDHSVRVAGMLTYRTEHLWLVPLAVQVVCEPPGRTNKIFFHHLHNLPRGEGEIRFSLSPLGDLRDREKQPFVGLLPLFFQIVIVGEPEKEASEHLSRQPTWKNPYPVCPPTSTQGPPVKQVLGEPFVIPSPMPAVVLPDTLKPFPPVQPMHAIASHFPQPPPAAPVLQRFRAISDIRAALVKVE